MKSYELFLPASSQRELHVALAPYRVSLEDAATDILQFYSLLFHGVQWAERDEGFAASLWTTLTGFPRLLGALSHTLEETEARTSEVAHSTLPLEGCLESWTFSLESPPYSPSRLGTAEIMEHLKTFRGASPNDFFPGGMAAVFSSFSFALPDALADQLELFLSDKKETPESAFPILLSQAAFLLLLRPGNGLDIAEDLLLAHQEFHLLTQRLQKLLAAIAQNNFRLSAAVPRLVKAYLSKALVTTTGQSLIELVGPAGRGNPDRFHSLCGCRNYPEAIL